MKVYFSDFFNVTPDVIEEYGAFNISLINDLPLFIDPFLLFNSNKKEYQYLHKEVLRYIAFLRDKSISMNIGDGLLRSWYCFPEVKQTWLGYSKQGNGGRGPGIEFARALNDNLSDVFSDFGKVKVTRGSHIEKLCLIKENIGRDNISDFVTNLIKTYLLEYTQRFAKRYIAKALLKVMPVTHVGFNYKTSSWVTKSYLLPVFNNNYVLLTPKDLLTKDNTWINKPDLINEFQEIVSSVTNDELRSQLDFYFIQNLPKPKKTKKGKEKEPSRKEISAAISAVMKKYPEILDYYIRHKEDQGDKATSVSKKHVKDIHSLFVTGLAGFIDKLSKDTNFYNIKGDTLKESYERVMFLKDVIENKDGNRKFYFKGNPIKREEDIHIMFRLTWFATPSDVTNEAGGGRGSVDFKISRGAHDKTLVEFKLASNSKLQQNLKNQVEIYKKAHDTDKSIKVILFFTPEEEMRVKKILKELGLLDEKYIVLIDAQKKMSASNVK